MNTGSLLPKINAGSPNSDFTDDVELQKYSNKSYEIVDNICKKYDELTNRYFEFSKENKLSIFKIPQVSKANNDEIKIHNRIPIGPNHTLKGIISKISPKPMGCFFVFLNLNQ